MRVKCKYNVQIEVYLDFNGEECEKGNHSCVKLVGDYEMPEEKFTPKFNKKKYDREYMRNHPQYWYSHTWSEKIKKRDNYECVCCGNKDNLNAHHILFKKHYPKLKMNLNNGITLCVECHVNFHKLNGK